MAPPAASSAGSRDDVLVQADGTLRFFGTPLTLREWRLPVAEARGILKSSSETQFVSLSSLSRFSSHDAFVAAKTGADVAILGIVSDVGSQRSTENSHLWSWTLWDLQETKVKLLLRGEALCRTLQKEDVKPGMLLAVLNPTLLEQNPQYDSRCVSVDKADNILLIGGVQGVMRCGAMTKKQTPCSMMVYVPTMGDFCRFHISSRAAKSQDARVKSRQIPSSSFSSRPASSSLASSASSNSSVKSEESGKVAPPVVAPHRRLLHGSGEHTPGPGREVASSASSSASLLKLKETLETKERQEARIASLLRANPALRKANHKVALERQQREAAQSVAPPVDGPPSSIAKASSQPPQPKAPSSQPKASFSALRKSVSATAESPHSSPSAAVPSCSSSSSSSSPSPPSSSSPSSSLSSSVAFRATGEKREASLAGEKARGSPPGVSVGEKAVHAAATRVSGVSPSEAKQAGGGREEGVAERPKSLAREGRQVGGMLQEHLSDAQKKALGTLSSEFVRRRYLRLFYEIQKDDNTPGNRALFDELTSVRVEMKSYTRQDFQVMGLVDLMPPLCLHPDQTIAELALTIWRAAHFRLQATVNPAASSPAASMSASGLPPETRNLRAEEVSRRLAVDVANVKEIFKKRQKEEKKRQREIARERTESEKRMRQKQRDESRTPAAARGVCTPESRDEQREMLQEIMRVKSTIQEHVDKADFEEEQQMLKLLEKQDAREEFKQSIREIQIEAFFCHQCNEYCDKLNPVCSKAGHTIEKKKAIKRFFRCPECMYSPIIAIGHTLPDGCPRCRVALKNLLLPAVSAYKPKAIKPLQNEILTITGEDEDHRCRSRPVKPLRAQASDPTSDDWSHEEENVQVAANALES
uniref:Mcm10 replication factor n=1 Tax=Toxoplasma gondii COUG TaxID=1074873 RepID=A0A2G8YDD6_TOXGO|nr:Mcm10 replication factor [Toxoplasma gondii COUG]